ncbi:MAG: homoserine O-succinyltransferase [Eubacteriales bacterium]
MPVKIPDTMPAREILEGEDIFVMTELKAVHQDIRPLRIIILNIMPTKVVTETQLLRLLSNTPLQIEVTFLQTATYQAKNTSVEHLSAFYKSFEQVKDEKFDGLIITGAPVENLSFEDVAYWPELCSIMEWSKKNVYSTMHICWGAQAGLYYHYGIHKHPLDEKMFGVFEHKVLFPSHPLLRGFDEIFMAPHSRHTEVRRQDIENVPELTILTESPRAGVHIVCSYDNRNFYITGHSEYDYDTLSREYFRDVEKGLEIRMPENYFPGDDATVSPRNTWRAHAHLLFNNWLNFFVYQETPYNINEISK